MEMFMGNSNGRKTTKLTLYESIIYGRCLQKLAPFFRFGNVLGAKKKQFNEK
jgi:hypothetical protein